MLSCFFLLFFICGCPIFLIILYSEPWTPVLKVTDIPCVIWSFLYEKKQREPLITLYLNLFYGWGLQDSVRLKISWSFCFCIFSGFRKSLSTCVNLFYLSDLISLSWHFCMGYWSFGLTYNCRIYRRISMLACLIFLAGGWYAVHPMFCFSSEVDYPYIVDSFFNHDTKNDHGHKR